MFETGELDRSSELSIILMYRVAQKLTPKPRHSPKNAIHVEGSSA